MSQSLPSGRDVAVGDVLTLTRVSENLQQFTAMVVVDSVCETSPIRTSRWWRCFGGFSEMFLALWSLRCAGAEECLVELSVVALSDGTLLAVQNLSVHDQVVAQVSGPVQSVVYSRGAGCPTLGFSSGCDVPLANLTPGLTARVISLPAKMHPDEAIVPEIEYGPRILDDRPTVEVPFVGSTRGRERLTDSFSGF